MLLVLDNYDSFTWNLVQALGTLGADISVVRNDEATVDDLLSLPLDRVVVSPGPCTPAEAGVSVELIRRLPDSVPLLGVCLGHQALAEAFGGRTVRARNLMHGKLGVVRHLDDVLFAGVPETFRATRYHSLTTDPEALPASLTPIAWSAEPGEEGEIQAVRHRERPSWGVQFHPESLFSEYGVRLLNNFLGLRGVR